VLGNIENGFAGRLGAVYLLFYRMNGECCGEEYHQKIASIYFRRTGRFLRNQAPFGTIFSGQVYFQLIDWSLDLKDVYERKDY